MTVRTFKGRTLVDLREFYMKGRAASSRQERQAAHAFACLHLMSPCAPCTLRLNVSLQAGIALTEEQWGVVRANAASTSAALAAHDATFELPLGSERRMQVPVP